MKTFCHIYAQWDQVGPRIDEDARHLLGLGLVCDTAFRLDRADRQLPALHRIAAAGGLCAPAVYPAELDPACADPNWWKYSAPECERLLERLRDRHRHLGLGPLQAINTYTPGNTLVAACRAAGVQYLLGFCAPTVIEDGGWEISHYGAPLSPYFAGDEDYRKPEAPGARLDGVLISSMELRNPLVCIDHWSEGPWCPLNAQAADRWLEPGPDPLPFLQIAEDWLRQAELSGEPGFFHLNLQYFFAGRCRAHNRRALEWLARQRDLGRLEIGGLRQWRERLRAGGGFLRQRTYWRGEMMGFHVGHRPGGFPDVVVEESLAGQTVWQHPHPLPRRQYDYTTAWAWPAFQPDGTAPASAGWPDIEVTASRSALEIHHRGTAPRPLALVAWEACNSLAPPFAVEVAETAPGWTAAIIPHPGGTGAALKLEGVAAPGRTSVGFRVTGRPPARVVSREVAGLVVLQTFFHQGRPCTVLAAQTPESFFVEAELRLSARPDEPVEWEQLTGLRHEKRRLAPGETRVAVRFAGLHLACWHRFWGVSADEIEIHGAEEASAKLRQATQAAFARFLPGDVVAAEAAADGFGYQRFGNIRDPARWDRRLARAAGETELRRVNAWFRAQRPQAGEFLIEAHPGIFLPRGSITKVLGHEFDFVQCAPGVGFRELCVDYPQGWDWGVAAWVQWRNLKLRVDGLQTSPDRPYVLHLQAFDPEHRDITQRVHLFNPAAEADEDVCVVRDWDLPAGLDGRLDPASLRSFPLPDRCLAWPAIGVWIVPLEKRFLHDWIAERGAPGLLSHLWLTRP